MYCPYVLMILNAACYNGAAPFDNTSIQQKSYVLKNFERENMVLRGEQFIWESEG